MSRLRRDLIWCWSGFPDRLAQRTAAAARSIASSWGTVRGSRCKRAALDRVGVLTRASPTFAVRPPRAHDGRTCRPFWMARRAEERTCSFATRTMPRVIPEQEEREAAPCPDLDARARRDSTCFREGKKRAVRFFLLGFSCSDFGLLSWEPASFGSWVRSYQLRVPLEGGHTGNWQLAA